MRFRHTHTAAATGTLLVAALTLAGCAASGQPADTQPTLDPDEEVSISFTFWGNDVRAALYDEAIAEFEDQHPHIDVKILFLSPNDYWEKRQIEAAGGGLPDVVTMDLAYLRQYSESGSLLDLEPYLGSIIQTDPIDSQVLSAGVVDDTTTAVPLSTNSWGMFLNTTLLEEYGVDPFDGGSWDDYYDWMSEVSAAAGAQSADVWGGVDPITRIENFELQLRAEGGNLFEEDGTPGFDEERLAEFWDSTSAQRADGGVAPQQRVAEVQPLTAFDAALTASDATWDNTGAGFLGNLGEGFDIELIAPPLSEDGGKDLYLKASQMYSIAANSDHPAAAATLIDFLINSPESGEIFGTNRGLPASATARDAANLDELSQTIADYESSVADRRGEAPPVPIVGYGSLHEKFRELGEELGFGTITVDEAAAQFFAEMDVVVDQ
ncbi:extracellular solute-binding protein [Microbacterium sp.]|uniref:ABC transporter substrate-binding protein n=1 Tax=Microbacterium sp. TaxID=51671 RepID=UPI00289D806B|nr:extracellular solute-binding protein [Microbacterium sp.]